MSPKLSDALRGMADRAPVGEFSVSSADAARRVRRHRTVRTTANSLVGVGAAAVLAFAVIAPNVGGTSADLKVGTAQDGAPPEMSVVDAVADVGWMGYCGAAYSPDATTQPATLEFEFPGSTSEAGTPQVTVIRTGTEDFTGVTGAMIVYTLWDGIVVGYSIADTDAPQEQVTWRESDMSLHTVDLDRVNCWDGTALPQGDYVLVATQVVYPDGPEVIIGGEPGVIEPSGDDSSHRDSAGGDTPGSDVAVVFRAPELLASAQVPTFIEGDAVEDPFGEYLNGPDPGIGHDLPDDYLMPVVARDLYATHLTGERWDMAPGTQRVVMANTEGDYYGNLYSANFFGCSWDGTQPAVFPTQSAQWDLLSVAGAIPADFNVSYGYVVDGNPEFTLAVTNTSGFTLPGMYQPDSTLMLVKDGVVVAQSYGTPTSRNPRYETAQYLSPESTVRQNFLWRDVDGCWRGGSQQAIEPGTYTVVNMQSVYIMTSSPVYFGDGVVRAYPGEPPTVFTFDADGLVASAEREALASMAVSPDYFDASDFVEFQVWTSLGTVTVTTH